MWPPPVSSTTRMERQTRATDRRSGEAGQSLAKSYLRPPEGQALLHTSLVLADSGRKCPDILMGSLHRPDPVL
jgi:hypothetical protein